MDTTYVAVKDIVVHGVTLFRKGDVVNWAALGSTFVFKKLLKARAIKVGTDKKVKDNVYFK